jgi:hypothetical protein
MAGKTAMQTPKNLATITERHLLGFARSYLCEAFPNPGREGCPSPEALRAFAEHPRRSEGSLTSHLSVCSPCFNAYLGCLERARLRIQGVRRVQGIKISATAAILFSLTCFLLISRHHPALTAPHTDVGLAQPRSSLQLEATATPIPVIIDLGNASPMRGAPDVGRGPAPPVIPSSPSVNLILKLPLGSEDRNYSIRLNSHGSAVWFFSAKARFDHGQMLLQSPADFSQVSPGRYELAVVARNFRVSTPVLVKNSSPATIRKP